jgi:hypothetical protein
MLNPLGSKGSLIHSIAWGKNMKLFRTFRQHEKWSWELVEQIQNSKLKACTFEKSTTKFVNEKVIGLQRRSTISRNLRTEIILAEVKKWWVIRKWKQYVQLSFPKYDVERRETLEEILKERDWIQVDDLNLWKSWTSGNDSQNHTAVLACQESCELYAIRKEWRKEDIRKITDFRCIPSQHTQLWA